MLPHKDIDKFIKKYNNTFRLKGYSKMTVIQKNRMMESKVKAVHDSRIKSEFASLKKQHEISTKKLNERTKSKPKPKPKPMLPKIKKKKRKHKSLKPQPNQSIFD